MYQTHKTVEKQAGSICDRYATPIGTTHAVKAQRLFTTSSAEPRTIGSSQTVTTKAAIGEFNATKYMSATTRGEFTLKVSLLTKAATHQNSMATHTAISELSTVKTIRWSTFDELCKAGTEMSCHSTTRTVNDDTSCGFVAM